MHPINHKLLIIGDGRRNAVFATLDRVIRISTMLFDVTVDFPIDFLVDGFALVVVAFVGNFFHEVISTITNELLGFCGELVRCDESNLSLIVQLESLTHCCATLSSPVYC
jgi:hypothetical protein